MPKKKKRKIKVIYKKLAREKVWGLAYIDPDCVVIERRLKGKRLLKLLCHEISHIALPDCSEKQILKLEQLLGETLWEQNYRKVDQ